MKLSWDLAAWLIICYSLVLDRNIVSEDVHRDADVSYVSIHNGTLQADNNSYLRHRNQIKKHQEKKSKHHKLAAPLNQTKKQTQNFCISSVSQLKECV